jgi:DnaJ family protein A protein 2
VKVVEEKKILKVEIDKGTVEGKRIVFKGESDEEPDRVPGDLIFEIYQKPHAVFTRKGVHLFMEKEIPLVNALTGFKFVVEHLDGRKILVQTKPGDIIKPNDRKEIVREGMPFLSRPYEKGSLFMLFKVVFPTKLSTNQISHIKKSLPDAAPEPMDSTDFEEAVLKDADLDNMKNERPDASRSGNAYDESDSDEGGPQGVQCAQQ